MCFITLVPKNMGECVSASDGGVRRPPCSLADQLIVTPSAHDVRYNETSALFLLKHLAPTLNKHSNLFFFRAVSHDYVK